MTKHFRDSRTTTSTATTGDIRRIRGPAELVQAVPYLLGFHPRRSLVLIGLRDGRLVVTARLDLDDVVAGAVLGPALRTMCQGGTTEVVAAVFDHLAEVAGVAGGTGRGRPLPWAGLAAELGGVVDELPCRVLDVLFVEGDRWWAYACDDDGCCPPDGNPVPGSPSPFATAATVDGVVPLPDRESLADVLAPLPDARRAALEPALADAENATCAAVLQGGSGRHERALKRALFASARASAAPHWQPPGDEDAARFAVALAGTPMRDAVWLAVDDRRLDGRVLWRELARRAPAPYDAAPLLLFGWATWRAGNSALAGIAAERALDSDPTCTAADLLLAALSHGIDPRRMPRLRRPA